MQIFSDFDVFGKENSILNRFLFPAPKPSYTWSSFEGELMCLVGTEGNIVPCTVMPGMCSRTHIDPRRPFLFDDPASALVIYCHANGEDIGVLYEAGHWLCDTLGVHVLIPEYPGYGIAPGSPNELSVTRNIRTTYDFAVNGLNWDPSRVLFFGRSIGTGPAVKMAAEVDCGGLILVSPYTSVKDIVSQHAGLVTSWLTAELTNIYPSDESISDVECPTLIVHGATDKVIPCQQARTLYQNSTAQHKRLVVLEDIGHHGIDLHFAVAHECPRLFTLDDKPRYMDIDGYLADPGMQGDTVASPVPVFDCRSNTWSRPTLERGATPFLREPPEGSSVSVGTPQGANGRQLQAPHPMFNGPEGSEALAGMVSGYIVTDDVLLAHVRAEVQEEHDQFVKARSSPPKAAPGAAPGARPEVRPDVSATILTNTLSSHEESALAEPLAAAQQVEFRTDANGKIVPRATGPPSGPGAQSSEPKLFLY
mmetsp:Transcript_517/g.1116  ORF Transcript_517/g.1116 Transcript_517/m.1116 type:complete len:479 (-) Transcript_517:346-1782(-)|eukprot:CAMPEP_0177690558 /NCGR_PEP_ID=MMETSP0484_2-20121128/832_1 /TAXON_ID=354590 /ORGANISM="Rhodomonas lens, Strain RHODO" /LENGTH=478 /DNA_ID=CAMNT_0019201113 /DNA_START=175 /DNA_END=1611 /DNA_ORIENTATION=-